LVLIDFGIIFFDAILYFKQVGFQCVIFLFK